MNTKIDEDFNANLGKRLSALRQNHKMSLEYLGIMLGVTHQQIHKYETGETTMGPRRIKICAKLFHVPVGYFYGEEDDMSRQNPFDKTTLIMATEMQKLPDDVRKGFYLISQQINKAFIEAQQKNDNEHAA